MIGQAICQLLCLTNVYSKHAGCVLRLLNRTDCYVWLYQKNFWLFMFELHLISGITDGWQGCEPPPPPANLNVETGRLPGLYFGIYILLVSVDCFFAFFLKRSPISQPHTLGLRRCYSDGKAVGNSDGLRRRLHPRWRISLLQSLCRALGQTEASSNF